MSRAPLLTALLGGAAILALPVSLHFEGNEGTAEPFLVVFPIAALVAATGAVIAWRLRVRALLVLNVIAGGATALFWLALLTYQGD